jgi:hypothetical protein
MADTLVRGANPIWWLPDLTGLPLNDQYYAFFLENTIPYLPQNVYQDAAATTVWNNPLQFQPSGTLPNNLYFDPDKTYRIEIRQGNTQNDPLIWLIENYNPSEDAGANAGSAFGGDNLVSNPQFSEVDFTNDLILEGEGTFDIAPGWQLFLDGDQGGANARLTLTPVDGQQNQVNSPPYFLRLQIASYTTAELRQVFTGNGAIFSSVNNEQTGVVSMGFTARADDDYPIEVTYQPSVGIGTTVIQDTVFSGVFKSFTGIKVLPESNNSNTGDNATVTMVLALQGTGNLEISNLQMVGGVIPVDSELPAPTEYIQETIERGVDHLFHYYKDSLVMQPKEDILTGWNFSLNPYQFIAPAISAMPTDLTQYRADQTIVRQEFASSIETGQASAANNFAFQVQPVDSQDSRVALIQYVDAATIRPYWNKVLSSLAKVKFVSPTLNTNVGLKMRLIYRNDLPPTLDDDEPITGWDVNGDPEFDTSWDEILPLNDPTYTLENGSDFVDFSFDQFQMPAAENSTMYLGVVIYTTEPFVSTPGNKDQLIFDSVSLVNNDFAIASPPETWDESLRKCQYYYEKSYNNAILPGDISISNQLVRPMVASRNTGNGFAAAFGFEFNSIKRALPTIQLYNPYSGTANNVRSLITRYLPAASALGDPNVIAPAANPFWLAPIIDTKAANYATTTPLVTFVLAVAAADNIHCEILFHYTADARLGN